MELEFVQIDNKPMATLENIEIFLNRMIKKHGAENVKEHFNYFMGAFCNENGFYMGLNPKNSNVVIYNDLNIFLQYGGTKQ